MKMNLEAFGEEESALCNFNKEEIDDVWEDGDRLPSIQWKQKNVQGQAHIPVGPYRDHSGDHLRYDPTIAPRISLTHRILSPSSAH